MMTRRLFTTTTLLLTFLTTCCILMTHVAADQRSVLMNVGGTPPESLGKAGVHIMHNLPRANGGNQLGIIARSQQQDPERYDANVGYAKGVLLPFVSSIIFAMITWVLCFGFCCGRSCCDTCGGRIASEPYEEKDRLYLKLGMLVVAASVVVLFFIGVVSNAAVSSSLDDAYLKSDALVEHLYKFNTPLKSMSLVAADAYAQVQGLNTSVYYQLPNVQQEAIQQACTDTMYQTLVNEQIVLMQLAPLTGGTPPPPPPTYSVPSSPPLDLTSLQQQLKTVDQMIKNYPSFSSDMNALKSYNQTLYNLLPSPFSTASYTPVHNVYQLQYDLSTASSIGDRILNNMNPALLAGNNTIAPLLNIFSIYDASATLGPLSLQQSLYNHISNGDVSATTKNEIAKMKQSLDSLPATQPALDALNNFRDKLTIMQAEVGVVATAMNSYLNGINALGTSSRYISVITTLKTTLSGYTSPTNLITNLALTGSLNTILQPRIITLLTNLTTTDAILTAMKYQTDTTQTGTQTNPTLKGSVSQLNVSLPKVQCIKSVFASLVYQNNTILIFPKELQSVLSKRNAILIQLQRIIRIQADMNQTLLNLAPIKGILGTYPDMTSVANSLQTLFTSISAPAFPDAGQASTEIGNISSDVAAVSVGYLNTLIGTNFTTFNITMNSGLTDVKRVANQLNTLTTLMNSFPIGAPFIAWLTYTTSLAAAASNIQSDMQAVYDQSTQTTFIPVADPLKTSFLTKLQSFSSVFLTAPSAPMTRAQFETALVQLRNEISNTIIQEGAVVSTLNTLQGGAQTYTNATLLHNLVSRINTDTTLPAAVATLLTTTPHKNLNQTVATQPNYSITSGNVNATAVNLAKYTPALKSLESDIQSSTGFMSPVDYYVMKAGLTAMGDLHSNFPDLTSPLHNLDIASRGLQEATDSVKNYRHSYYVARQSTVVFKNHLDWLRLLGYLMLLFVPIIVSACGFIGWWAEKPMCSIYQGMCSFALIAIFFCMTAIQVIPAVLIADQCSDLDGFLTANFNQYGLSPSAAQPWINLTQSTSAGAIFSYFSSCDNPRPILLDQFAQPEAVLTNNHINFTQYRQQVQKSLSDSNNTIQLQSSVWNYFTALDGDTQDVVVASKQVDSLVDCAKSQLVWAPFRTSICSNEGVNGAIALSTCVLFLFAVCLIPSVCIGIIGYKRFDKENMTDPDALPPPMKFNPYAAGTIAHSPSGLPPQILGNGQQGGAPGGKNRGPIRLPKGQIVYASEMELEANPAVPDPALLIALEAAPEPFHHNASVAEAHPSRRITVLDVPPSYHSAMNGSGGAGSPSPTYQLKPKALALPVSPNPQSPQTHNQLMSPSLLIDPPTGRPTSSSVVGRTASSSVVGRPTSSSVVVPNPSSLELGYGLRNASHSIVGRQQPSASVSMRGPSSSIGGGAPVASAPAASSSAGRPMSLSNGGFVFEASPIALPPSDDDLVRPITPISASPVPRRDSTAPATPQPRTPSRSEGAAQ